MIVATVTSKGQITIPKEIRDNLHLRTGDRVEFQSDSQGRVFLRACNQDFRALKGILRRTGKTTVSVEEMNEAIARGFSKT